MFASYSSSSSRSPSLSKSPPLSPLGLFHFAPPNSSEYPSLSGSLNATFRSRALSEPPYPSKPRKSRNGAPKSRIRESETSIHPQPSEFGWQGVSSSPISTSANVHSLQDQSDVENWDSDFGPMRYRKRVESQSPRVNGPHRDHPLSIRKRTQSLFQSLKSSMGSRGQGRNHSARGLKRVGNEIDKPSSSSRVDIDNRSNRYLTERRGGGNRYHPWKELAEEDENGDCREREGPEAEGDKTEIEGESDAEPLKAEETDTYSKSSGSQHHLAGVSKSLTRRPRHHLEQVDEDHSTEMSRPYNL